MFKGCSTALVTPMRVDGSVDYDGLEQLLNKRGAILVNETLNMPTFLRRGGQRGRRRLREA